MRRSWWGLLAESARVARATRIVSTLILLLAITVPSMVIGTAGLSLESQAAILGRVDEVGARIITLVSSGTSAALPAGAVGHIARLDGVDWVVGLGPVSDVSSRGLAGVVAPVRRFTAVRAPVQFSRSRSAQGAYISPTSMRRLGLNGAYSLLDPGGVPVSGWFRADQPLTSLESFVLIPVDADSQLLERIIIAVHDVGWVEPVAGQLSTMVGDDAALEASVQRSAALLEARDAVRDEVTRRDRELVVVFLAGSVTLSCAVVFSGTIAGRRDFGRRRALGATQGQLICLVMFTTSWPAVIGATAGTVGGWLYLSSRLGYTADWRFPAAVGVLATLAPVAASVLPAVIAATRDPLRVLRVP